MMVSSVGTRHLLLTIQSGLNLHDALLNELRSEVIVAGWVRGVGVVENVRLRTVDGQRGTLGPARTLPGVWHLLSLEGSVGFSGDDITCGMHALVSQQTEAGSEVLAGEIVSGTVLAFEAIVVALDDASLTRVAGSSGMLFANASGSAGSVGGTGSVGGVGGVRSVLAAPAAVSLTPAAAAGAAVAVAAAASAAAPGPNAAHLPFRGSAAMPARPVAAKVAETESVYPDAGDTVEHFAFGRCEVVQSDGDRLHLRLDKDGRVKEIALDMLRVTALPAEAGLQARRFKLDRRL